MFRRINIQQRKLFYWSIVRKIESDGWVTRVGIDDFTCQIQYHMRMGAARARRAAAACACLRPCCGWVEGLCWVHTVGNGLLQRGDVGLFAGRRKGDAICIPYGIAAKIESFTISERQCYRACCAGKDLFAFKYSVAFN